MSNETIKTAQFEDLNDEEIKSAINGPPTAPSAMQSNSGEENENRDDLLGTNDAEKVREPKRQLIRLSGRHTPVTVNGVVNIGMEKPIYLPGEKEQRAGFYVENWQALVTQYQGIYKLIKESERLSLTEEAEQNDTEA